MLIPNFNLKPFGMNWSINPNSSTYIPPDYYSRLARFRSDGSIFESSRGIIYTKKEVLGKGTYGVVHSCVRSSDNKLVAVKTLTGSPLDSVVKETIIQALIYELTKGLKHPEIGLIGPYCPALYEIGYDETTSRCYIVSELMRATTYKLLTSKEGDDAQLEIIVPTILMQISTILIDLYKLLKFNHRDFKSDNCMYIRDESNNIQVRLIDFGFSCINYGNCQISGGEGIFKYCSLKSRDLTQLIYEIYKFHKYIPNDLRKVLEALLVFKTGKSICYMHKKCNDIVAWEDTYTFLNTKVANPNGTPLTVFKVFKAYFEKKEWKDKLAYTPIPIPKEMPAVPIKCPENKVYNPLSQRCVLATGAVGKRLLLAAAGADDKLVAAAAVAIKVCPKEKPDYNPATKRCVKSCVVGKKRNSTYKCVKA